MGESSPTQTSHSDSGRRDGPWSNGRRPGRTPGGAVAMKNPRSTAFAAGRSAGVVRGRPPGCRRLGGMLPLRLIPLGQSRFDRIMSRPRANLGGGRAGRQAPQQEPHGRGKRQEPQDRGQRRRAPHRSRPERDTTCILVANVAASLMVAPPFPCSTSTRRRLPLASAGSRHTWRTHNPGHRVMPCTPSMGEGPASYENQPSHGDSGRHPDLGPMEGMATATSAARRKPAGRSAGAVRARRLEGRRLGRGQRHGGEGSYPSVWRRPVEVAGAGSS